MRQRPASLRRTLGFWQVTVSGVGIVIGAGIYVLIGEAAVEAGPALWLSFIVAAVLAALTGLSYAELAGMFPTAGAEYEFARRAFNDAAGFITGWIMGLANIIAAAAVSIGFARYLQAFVDVPVRVGAVLLLIVLTLAVALGIGRAIWFSALLVAFQVGGLLLVIWSGAPQIGSYPLLSGSSAQGIVAGSALVFFAFIGFDEVVTLSEDTVNPERVIPRALLLALAISTALYVLVGISAVSLVGADALASSPRPLALVVEHQLGSRGGATVSFLALASTMNTTLLVLTAASRIIYSMARGGVLPAPLASLGRGGRAPWAAALLAMVVAMAFALAGGLGLVASITDFGVYLIFLVVNAAVIALRVRLPRAPRAFRIPFSVGPVPVTAVAGFATGMLMMVYLERTAWLAGLVVVAVGVLAWFVFARNGLTATES